MISSFIPELTILLVIGILLVGPERAGREIRDFYAGLRRIIGQKSGGRPREVKKNNNW